MNIETKTASPAVPAKEVAAAKVAKPAPVIFTPVAVHIDRKPRDLAIKAVTDLVPHGNPKPAPFAAAKAAALALIDDFPNADAIETRIEIMGATAHQILGSSNSIQLVKTMAILNPIVLTGASPFITDYSWLQKGYTYGRGDSGPWQKFSREGRASDIQQWSGILDAAGWTWQVEFINANLTTTTNGHYYGIAKLEASCGWPFPYLYGTETPEDIWELDPQDEQKNLLEADYPFSSTSPFAGNYTGSSINLESKLTRDALKKIIDDPAPIWYPAGIGSNTSDYGIVVCQSANVTFLFDDGALKVGDASDIDFAILAGYLQLTVSTSSAGYVFVHLPSIDYAAAYSLYLLAKNGVDTFPIEGSVIRHSQITSNQYAVKASFINNRRIISTPSMTTVEGTPGNLLFDVPTLPTPLQFIEYSAAAYGQGDLQYGWFKHRPAVSRLNRMKWRIVSNYQLGLWPVNLFGGVL